MMAERMRAHPSPWPASPYIIPDKSSPSSQPPLSPEESIKDPKKKRKYVDQRRRENTRRCVDELAVLVNDVGTTEKPNVSSILAATVQYIRKLEAEIANERQAESEQGSEATWVGLLGDSDDNIQLVTDLDGTIVYAARSAHKLLGYDPQALLRTPLHGIVHPEDRRLLSTRISPDRPARLAARLLTANGHAKMFALSVRTVTDTSTGTKYIALVGQDHPLRFGLEQRLLPYSATHRDQWVTHHSPNGTFVKVSSNIQEMFGLTSFDVLGKSPYVYYHPDDIGRVIDSHSTVIGDGSSRVVYRFFNKRLNRHVWVQTVSSVVMDDATGQPCGIICRTSFCSPLSVSILAPSVGPAIAPASEASSADTLRRLIDTLNEENAVLRDILDRYSTSPPSANGGPTKTGPPVPGRAHPPPAPPQQHRRESRESAPDGTPGPALGKPMSSFSIDMLMR